MTSSSSGYRLTHHTHQHASLRHNTRKNIIENTRENMRENTRDDMRENTWENTGLVSGCRRPILTKLFPVNLSHNTAVTSQDHRHCNDNNLNVNDEDVCALVSCQSFKTEWMLWRISCPYWKQEKKPQNPLTVEIVDDLIMRLISPKIEDVCCCPLFSI